MASIGISSDLATAPYPVNEKIVIGFLLLGASISCNVLYAIYEAKTFADYNQSIFIGSETVLITFGLLTIVQNVAKLFAFIEGCEVTAAKTSEYLNSTIKLPNC